MFTAQLLSMTEGQSYQQARMFEDPDFEKYDIPKPFEEWTAAFEADNKFVLAHHWQMLIIQLTNERRPAGPSSTALSRLVLKNDVVYENVKIINQDNWSEFGIPIYFTKYNGIAGQMAFTCGEGTFITHDCNVVSLILEKPPRLTGVVRSSFSAQTSAKYVGRQAAKPDTVHGNIK